MLSILTTKTKAKGHKKTLGGEKYAYITLILVIVSYVYGVYVCTPQLVYIKHMQFFVYQVISIKLLKINRKVILVLKWP